MNRARDGRAGSRARPLGRRAFLRRTAGGVIAAGTVLEACGGGDAAATSGTGAPGPGPPQEAGPLREVRRVAAPAEIDLGPLGTRTIWTYDGRYPGAEIRVREGDRLRAVVENGLPEGTTVHWHGIPVPNAMDGVPGVTQEPIPPGGTFAYEYTAGPAGTYLYHSHQGLQLDRGLLGPLVVEERSPHVAYDREYTLVLDDLLPGPPRPLAARGMGPMGPGGGGALGIPDYEAYLVNGRPPADPPALEVRSGERVRLRLVNPSGATAFHVAIAGHRMDVTHADGRPVDPVTVDALRIGMGERYDVVVAAEHPGAWAIRAAALHGGPEPAYAVLRYADAAAARPPDGQVPEGLRGGRLLQLDDLSAVEPLEPWSEPDRAFDLVLSGGMMSSAWTIDGRAYPDAEPLEIRAGELVRVRMRNASMGLHPMHLHGHFFRVGDVWKDTVNVPPGMSEVRFQFRADNPGRWFFHCHNVYHLEAGMARVVQYA